MDAHSAPFPISSSNANADAPRQSQKSGRGKRAPKTCCRSNSFITPVTIWISALTKSWKLDENGKGGFVLKETGQDLHAVIQHCLDTHFGKKIELH